MDRLHAAEMPGEAGDHDTSAGNPPARHDIAAYIRAHQDMVRGTCRRVLAGSGAGDEVDDAVQETFIAMSAQLSGPEGVPANLGGWLRTVATHTAVSRLRARRSRRRHERTLAQAPAVQPGRTVDDEAELLDACVAELSDSERDLIVRIFYAGESQAEIAAAGRVSRVAVHKRLHRTLGRLRQMMGRRGVRIGVPALLLLLADGDRQLAAAAAPAWSAGAAPVLVAVAAIGLAGGAALAGHAAPVPPAVGPEPAQTAWSGPLPEGGGIVGGHDHRNGADTAGALLGWPPVVSELPWSPGMMLGKGPPVRPGGWGFSPIGLDRLQVQLVRSRDGRQTADMETVAEGYIALSACRYVTPVAVAWQDGLATALRVDPPDGIGVALMVGDGRLGRSAESRFMTYSLENPDLTWRLFRQRQLQTDGELIQEVALLATGGHAMPAWRQWRRVRVGDDGGVHHLGTTFDRRAYVFAVSMRRMSPDEELALDASCPAPDGVVYLDGAAR